MDRVRELIEEIRVYGENNNVPIMSRETIDTINKILDDGVNIILDRYFYSSFAHQGGKIEEYKERLEMYKWFEKLTKNDAILLIRRYLKEFRKSDFTETSDLHPFTPEAISMMVEMSEFNAAELLRRAHDLLSYAAENEGTKIIDANLVQKYEVGKDEDISTPRGQDTAPINLWNKA